MMPTVTVNCTSMRVLEGMRYTVPEVPGENCSYHWEDENMTHLAYNHPVAAPTVVSHSHSTLVTDTCYQLIRYTGHCGAKHTKATCTSDCVDNPDHGWITALVLGLLVLLALGLGIYFYRKYKKDEVGRNGRQPENNGKPSSAQNGGCRHFAERKGDEEQAEAQTLCNGKASPTENDQLCDGAEAMDELRGSSLPTAAQLLPSSP